MSKRSLTEAKKAHAKREEQPQAGAVFCAGPPETPEGDPREGSLGDLRASDALATTTPDPSIPTIIPPSTGPIRWNDYRDVALAGVGKDAEGKVIQHVYSEATAGLVADLVAKGATENFICMALNMRPGKLKQLYAHELSHAKEAADLMVASKAFEMATSGESEQMTKFWLERRHSGFQKGAAEDDSIFNIHIHS